MNKPTRTEQRAIRAAEAAFKASRTNDPMRRFADGLAALVGAMFKPRKISRQSKQQTKGQTP